MQYENVWNQEDDITTIVNAIGKEVWDMKYDETSGLIRLELSDHLQEQEQNVFIAHLSSNADYEGEGSHGSIFNINIKDI